MPEPGQQRKPATPVKGPSPSTVFWISASSFAALFGFLTYQLRTGQDPAVGEIPPPPKPVLMRNVVKRRVVTRLVPGAGSTSVSSSGSAITAAAPAAPVTTSSS
jgi:hypothetical protein